METMRYVWPLLMVIALIATAMILKNRTESDKRRKKGLKQHPRPKQVS